MALAKNLSVYVNGYNLSGAVQSVDATGEMEPLDRTALADASRRYETGIKNGTASFGGVWEYDATNYTKIHDVFQAAFQNGTMNYCLATLEDISGNAVNKQAILLEGIQTSYSVEIANAQLIMCNADIQASDGVQFGSVVFNATVPASTTSNGTANVASAASSNGGYMVVAVQNPSELTGATIKLQQSTNGGSTWADFSPSYSIALTAAKFQGASVEIPRGVSIPTHIRAVATVPAGGSITFVAGFARR